MTYTEYSTTCVKKLDKGTHAKHFHEYIFSLPKSHPDETALVFTDFLSPHLLITMVSVLIKNVNEHMSWSRLQLARVKFNEYLAVINIPY